jgi:hypothetical protein
VTITANHDPLFETVSVLAEKIRHRLSSLEGGVAGCGVWPELTPAAAALVEDARHALEDALSRLDAIVVVEGKRFAHGASE